MDSVSDLADHFRPELVKALERFVDERIALALDPEPVLEDVSRPGMEGEPKVVFPDNDSETSSE